MTGTARLTIAAALATVLGTAPLYSLFADAEWFWHGLLATVVVAGASTAARRLRMPALITPLIGAAAVTYYLTIFFAREQALWAFVPTTSSFGRLGELLTTGLASARTYAAPVPTTPEIVLLTAAGVGLIAIAVDWLAVGLRRAAVAGLPLLALYSVPVAIRIEGLAELAFGLGATGYLVLLLVDRRERIRRWGRPVRRRHTDDSTQQEASTRPDVSSIGATGRRVGLASLAIAVAIPALVPGLTPRLLFEGTLGSFGGNQNSITTPNPMVSLKRNLVRPEQRTVLRYSTSETDPSYLRMYALDTFNGRTWSMSTAKGRPEDRVSAGDLPTPQGLDSDVVTERVTTRVSVSPEVRDMSFLPLPYPPTRVNIEGDWRFVRPSLMVFSTSDAAGGTSYNVTSLEVQPTEEQLTETGPVPDQVADRYLDVPDSVPGRVRALARRVTRQAPSDYAKAMALQEWFTQPGNFTYSLKAPEGNSSSALASFLLHTRTGYCEQFAASMALMARIVDVPARVAVGYTPGQRGASGTWVVTTNDAHAWPELYFPGVGWLRFEPTPAGPGGQGSATVPGYAQAERLGGDGTDTGTGTGTEATAAPTAAPSEIGPRHQRGIDRSPTEMDEAGTGGTDWAAWLVGIALAVTVLALVGPLITRRATRRYRWSHSQDPSLLARTARPARLRPHRAETAGRRDPAGLARAAWLELRDDALDFGAPWKSGDSPRAAARRLTDGLELTGAPAAALWRIAYAEERARYARTPADPQGLETDSRAVRSALVASVPRRRRWRAWFFPRSTLRGLLRPGSRVGGADAS